MATIDGLGPAGPLRPATRPGTPARRSEGFAVPEQGEPAAVAADPAAVGQASRVAGQEALQMLQEAPAPLARDRAARRRAQELLQALAARQRALLAGGEAEAISLLESLLHDPPLAADPVLADLAAAVTLRVRVELARRGR